MKHALILAFFLLSLGGYSQNRYTIDGKITGFPGGMVYLSSFYGEFTSVFDSVEVTPDGNLQFVMDGRMLPGYYRIMMGEEQFVDLIYNNENISFSSDFDFIFDSLKIISSNENQIYYSLVKYLSDNQLELDILSPLTDIYPKGSILYPDIVKRFEQVQEERIQHIQTIVAEFPNAYVTRVVKAQRRPYLSPNMNEEERIEHLKLYYWDDIDLTDTSLLRSNVYPNLIIEYLGLYGNRQFTQEQLEESFIRAVDVMLGESMDNEKVYGFFLQYLVNGFERYHFDKVLDHIATNYAHDEMCENENLDEEVVKRLKNYQNLSVGKPAPEIILNNPWKNYNDLYSIKTQFVLILFWASWCPHCNEILPELVELYETLKMDIEILSVSIDTDKEAYQSALDEGRYPWINYCDFTGWDSRPAVDYNVYATPTMFLLDGNKTIIAKPITLSELLTELGKR